MHLAWIDDAFQLNGFDRSETLTSPVLHIIHRKGVDLVADQMYAFGVAEAQQLGQCFARIATTCWSLERNILQRCGYAHQLGCGDCISRSL